MYYVVESYALFQDRWNSLKIGWDHQLQSSQFHKKEQNYYNAHFSQKERNLREATFLQKISWDKCSAGLVSKYIGIRT